MEEPATPTKGATIVSTDEKQGGFKVEGQGPIVGEAKKQAPVAAQGASKPGTPADDALLIRIMKLEKELPPIDIPKIREVLGIGRNLADYDVNLIRAYQAELNRTIASMGE